MDEILSRPMQELGDRIGFAVGFFAETLQRESIEVKSINDFALTLGKFVETKLEEPALACFLSFPFKMSAFHHLLQIGIKERNGGTRPLATALVAVVIQCDRPHPGDEIGSFLESIAFLPGRQIRQLENVPRVGKVTRHADEKPEDGDLGAVQSCFERGFRFLSQCVHSK